MTWDAFARLLCYCLGHAYEYEDFRVYCVRCGVEKWTVTTEVNKQISKLLL